MTGWVRRIRITVELPSGRTYGVDTAVTDDAGLEGYIMQIRAACDTMEEKLETEVDDFVQPKPIDFGDARKPWAPWKR